MGDNDNTPFFLFGLSFIWFPTAKIDTEKMVAPEAETEPPQQNQQPTSIFEMPVDSFEQHLKQKVYETSMAKFGTQGDVYKRDTSVTAKRKQF